MRPRASVIGLLIACLLVTTGCGGPPQMAGNEECMTAADALWTAVNKKRTDLVDTSAAEIDRLSKAGTMPEAAYKELSEIITTARAGEWADARASLKSFIRGQRPAPR